VTLLLLGIVLLSRGIEFSGLLTSSDSRRKLFDSINGASRITLEMCL